MPSRTSVPPSPALDAPLRRPPRAGRRYDRRLGVALVVAGGWAAYAVMPLANWLAQPGTSSAHAALGLLGVLAIGGILYAVDIRPPGGDTTVLTIAFVLGAILLGGQVLFGLMAAGGDPEGLWRWAAPVIAQHPYLFVGVAAVPAFMLIASLLTAAVGRRHVAWAMIMVALGMTLSIVSLLPFAYFMRFAR